MDCSTQIVCLETRVEHLKKLHNNWKALCQQTIESGFPVADTRTAEDLSRRLEDLSRRLELVTRDVEVAIEITQYGISQEKDDHRTHHIYDTIDQSLELRRRLEQAEEELELRDAVTEATNRRREEEARSSSDKAHESVEPSQQPPSEKKANQSNEDRHRARLQENNDWLVNKIIAPCVATLMYQQGALTMRELETIRSCRDLTTQAAEQLVKIVEDQPYAVFRFFKDALKKTKQDDVYMTLADIDFKAKTEHCETIRKNYNLLLEKMDLKHSGALGELLSLQVIDFHDVDAIKSERTHIGMNEKLLALLSRKSFESFQKFLQALNETGQHHLVNSINEHPDESSGKVAQVSSTSRQTQNSQQTNTYAKLITDESSGEVGQLSSTSNQTQNVQQMTSDTKLSTHKSSGAEVQRVPTSQVQQTTAKRNAVSHVISSDERGEAVGGVAIYSDKLFVLRVRSERRIEQCDVKKFQEKFIKVKGLRDDGDYWSKSMTSCDINSCLYINDNYKVFRVNPSTKDVISWRVDGCPFGLSVNGTRNVLVTCYADNTIKEYSTDGSFVRSIKLQVNDVKSPLHCIQLTDSRYVVCHERPVHGVSEIDEHGTLIATYRNSETTELEMKWPQCVILFNDSLLVADTDNDRILLLNTSLSDARPLSLPVDSQLRRPRCMYLEQSRGRLFVGEVSGRVLVIDNIDLK